MDLTELKEILQILDERDIAEFELEEQGLKLRIRKAGGAERGSVAPLVASVVTGTMPATATAAPGPELVKDADPIPAAAAPVAVEAGLHQIKSPIVGTFYQARDPNSAPFVAVGDRVKVGQVLCIIEAMKMMNEIESEVAGEIVRVHPDNGQPVQYGEPLFAVRT